TPAGTGEPSPPTANATVPYAGTAPAARPRNAIRVSNNRDGATDTNDPGAGDCAAPIGRIGAPATA
ncbi:MAG: hypothetical protein ACR2LF_01510, partial [Jatrophihabitantaceae bacterium]